MTFEGVEDDRMLVAVENSVLVRRWSNEVLHYIDVASVLGWDLKIPFRHLVRDE